MSFCCIWFGCTSLGIMRNTTRGWQLTKRQICWLVSQLILKTSSNVRYRLMTSTWNWSSISTSCCLTSLALFKRIDHWTVSPLKMVISYLRRFGRFLARQNISRHDRQQDIRKYITMNVIETKSTLGSISICKDNMNSEDAVWAIFVTQLWPNYYW